MSPSIQDTETPAIETRIDASSVDYRDNQKYHQELLDDLHAKIKIVHAGGSERAVALHKKRGKITVRDRIELLLDEGEEFLEFSALAANGMYDDAVPSAGIVTGLGVVSGRRCIIVANDATVKGGTYYPETIKKHLRAQEIAMENHLPCLYLVDSGGVFLPKQAEVFPDKEHFGRFFYNQAQMSGRGIPQIAVVMGMCTAGGAYVPAMADECIIVRGTGTIYLGGPPLVKAATGEECNADDLGGADMHSRISGVTDHLVDNDEDAIALCRQIVENLNIGRFEKNENVEAPLYDPLELYGVVNRDLRRPGDVREVIARIVDGSRFHEFKRNYGTTLVTGFSKLGGRTIGIVGNSGILLPESALKGAHFVELCSQRQTPILFLQNITGFMVGTQVEQAGIIKHGAKMVQAVSTASVPKITVIVGSSNGAGNYAMCGRSYGGRFLFTWPNARVSVMGGEQAASVLTIVKAAQLARKGETLSEEDAEKIAGPVREQYESEGHPYYGTARIWDDGILEPAKTREALIRCFDAACQAPEGPRKTPVFRM
ncbi:MAG: methylcrotonoyl-CoA carboxylase [Elusimicrobia bacterium]|nr:MAG: methylcrotonoyl-CoA carboxylase [Elusimicrobiota bacterium]